MRSWPLAAALISTAASLSGSGAGPTAALQQSGDVSEATTSGSDSAFPSTGATICIEGKAVANFYLLGAAKCATTTLAEALYDSGMDGSTHHSNFANQSVPVKEPNIFDHLCRDAGAPTCVGVDAPDVRWTFASTSDVPCSYANVTLSDMTPSSVFLAGLPSLMAGVYGSQARKLSFVVLIREPLSRWESHFHYNQQNGHDLSSTFEEEVAETEQALTSYATYADIVANRSFFDLGQIGTLGWQHSMYGLLLHNWLNEPTLHASQFAILPMKYATRHTRETVELLAAHFNWAGIHPALAPERAEEFNIGDAHHDSPNSELSRGARYRLQSKYFTPDFEALSILLAERMLGSQTGLIVGGFDDAAMGPHGRAQRLRHHLSTWW